MEYRQLGRSGLKISPICLGTMMFGGAADEPTSVRIIDKARDAGINFISRICCLYRVRILVVRLTACGS